MKKNKCLATILSISLVVFHIQLTALADDLIDINETFVDGVFREYISESFDSDGDGFLSPSEIEEITEIDLSSYSEVRDLTGIKHLTSLETLDCSGSQVESIDVSNMNSLISINVSGCRNLEYLDCHNNQIESLELYGCYALMALDCSNNNISSFETEAGGHLPEFLVMLRAHNNNLTSIELRGCPVINYEYLHDSDSSKGYITHYNVVQPSWMNNICAVFTHDVGVEILAYETASVFLIDEETFPELPFRDAVFSLLDSDQNGIMTEYEVENITEIDINGCGISDLTGIERFVNLTTLDCGNNSLAELDVSYFPALSHVDCSHNQIASLDVSGHDQLLTLDCSHNQLTSLKMDGDPMLELNCSYNKLTSLAVNATHIRMLLCDFNELTMLDVSDKEELTLLECAGNQLTKLDVSGCFALEKLNCPLNQLENLDLYGLSNLKSLTCIRNQITELDISSSEYLVSIYNGTYNYSFDGQLVYDDGVTIICSSPSFSSHALALRDQIDVRFCVTFPETGDWSNCYVEFVSSDGRAKTVTYSGSEPGNSVNERYFVFSINALELADTIEATLHYGNTQTKTNTYSAMEYINYIHSHTEEYSQKVRDMVNALQDYGYYLQQSGWVDSCIHEPIESPYRYLDDSDIEAAIVGVDSFALVKDLGASGISESVKVALTLNTRTELRVSVKPDAGVSVLTSGYTERLIGNDTYYQYSVNGIGPKALGSEQTVEVETNRGTAIIRVSAMYYVKAMLNSGLLNDDQMNALTAYYNYYDAAMNY